MPIEIIPDSGDTPESTYVTKPDLRFATTFISNKHRDYAVVGETLQDKETGELFTRRPSDGRVVSFFHNAKYTRDLMLELRILLNNNTDWVYPNTENTEAIFLNIDYDLMEINDSKEVNIKTNDFIIPNDSTIYHNLKFKVSKDTNAFALRLTSRNTDKGVLGWLNNQYNLLVSNYSGTNEDWLHEKDKLNENPKWRDTDCTIEMTMTVDGIDAIYNVTDYIRTNEETCIFIPQEVLNNIDEYYTTKDPIEVTVKELKFDKIHFLFDHIDELGDDFTIPFNNFKTPDDKILLNYLNVSKFNDSGLGVDFYKNEFVVTLLDVDYVVRYLAEVGQLKEGSNFILSAHRPGDDIWKPNSLWAEHVSDTYSGNNIIETDSPMNINMMEQYLFNSKQIFTRGTFDPTEENDILFNIADVELVPVTLTPEEPAPEEDNGGEG